MAGDVARQVEIDSEFLGEQAQVFLVLAVTGSNVHVEPLARIAGAGDDRQQQIVHGRRGRLQAPDQLPDRGRDLDRNRFDTFLPLDLLPLVDDIVAVLHLFDMGGREHRHVDERNAVTIVGEEKQLAGVFALRIAGRGAFEFRQLGGRQVTFGSRLFEFGDLEPASSERIGRRRADTLRIGPVQNGPQRLEIEFARVAATAPLLKKHIESPDITQVDVGKEPLIQLPVIASQHVLRLLIGLGIADMSRCVQFRDTVGEIGVELALFGGVQKGVLELVQRPVDTFDLEAFDDLAGANLVLRQQRIAGFALFILGFLFGSFQVAQDDELLTGLVPICGIGVEIERDIFAPLVFGDTQPDRITAVAVGLVVTTGKPDGISHSFAQFFLLDSLVVIEMSYDKRMKILSKLDSIDPAEALTAYPRIAEYDAITKLPISRRRGKNNMPRKRLQIFFGFNYGSVDN